MKNQIPNNNVSKDYKGLLASFIRQINEVEPGNIISIFLTGSFARGDAGENSDLDIWCIFHEINSETLTKVGFISRNLPVGYDELEVNAQCLTNKEFQSSYFSKFLAYPILYLEAILLWGFDVASFPLKDKDVEKTYKELLAEVLLSIRHYIAVNEPAERLTHQKMKTWVFKPFMFALRLERYFYTKQYPLSISDLFNAYDTPPKLITYYLNEEKWNIDIQSDRDATLYALNNEIDKRLMPTA